MRDPRGSSLDKNARIPPFFALMTSGEQSRPNAAKTHVILPLRKPIVFCPLFSGLVRSRDAGRGPDVPYMNLPSPNVGAEVCKNIKNINNVNILPYRGIILHALCAISFH